MSDHLQDAPTPSEAPITRSVPTALGVLQRTVNAISPWVRQWWIGDTKLAPTNATSPRNARVPGQSPLSLRIQRSLAFVARADGGGGLTDRFSHAVVQRHASAEQIGRRYRMETRQPTGPAPTQLPLPGVQGFPLLGARHLQRAAGEMSLEELAQSYQQFPVSSAEAQPDVQREVDPSSENNPSQPASFAELQEAVRRASQSRTAPATSGSEDTPVQRSPENTPNNSRVASIEERIRQARQRQAAQGAPPPVGVSPVGVPAPRRSTPPAPPTPIQPTPRPTSAPTPTSTPTSAPTSSPTSVQRSPDEPKPVSLSNPGSSVMAAVEAKFQAAREQFARESGEAQSSAPAGTPIASATPSPSVQRITESPAPVGGGHELPATPAGGSWDIGDSKADAIHARIEAARARKAADVGIVKAPPTPEEIQRKIDPDSDAYSKSEVIRERIRQARESAQASSKPELSPNPGDPNYSVSEQIRQRLAANRAQRSTATPSEPPSADSASPSVPQPSPPSGPPQPPANVVGSSNAPVANADETIQRTPDNRQTLVRELRPQSPLAESLNRGAVVPPQAKRVRALSRSQILTPERKTGDFFAGETPKGEATALNAPSKVQRTIDVAPTPASPSESAAQREALSSQITDASGQSEAVSTELVSSDEAARDIVHRTSMEDVETKSTLRADVSSHPPAQPVAQRSTETPAALESVQRTPVDRVEEAVTPSADVVTESPTQPPVQRSVETLAAPPAPLASAPTPEPVQRTPVDRVEDTTTPASVTTTETPAPATSTSAPERVQRTSVDRVEEATTPSAEVTTKVPTQPVVQRSAEMPAAPLAAVESISVPERAQRAAVERVEEAATPNRVTTTESSAQPVVQRTVEMPLPLAAAENTSAPESEQRSVETPTVPQAAAESVTPESVQRAPVDSVEETATPSAVTATESSAQQAVQGVPSPLTTTEPTTQPTVQQSVEMPPPQSVGTDVTSATEILQRSSVERVESAEPSNPASASEPLSEQVVQRSAEIPTAPPAAGASTSAPERVQRTSVDRVEEATTPSAEVTTEPSAQPVVQRSAELSVIPLAAVEGAAEPGSAQLAPVERVEKAATLGPTVVPSVQPMVQRSADTQAAPPVPMESANLPKDVLRTPADRAEEASTPSGDVTTEAHAQPTMQPSVKTASAPRRAAESVPPKEGVQRTPVDRVEEAATSRSDTTNGSLTQPTVQRSAEAAAIAPVAMESAPAPESVQRASVERVEEVATPGSDTTTEPPTQPAVQRLSVDRVEPAVTPSADITTEPPAQPTVQRSVETLAAPSKATDVNPTQESWQHTSVERIEDAATSSPDATTERPVPVMVQRSIETPAAPLAAEESISAPESMQRAPVEPIEEVPIPGPTPTVEAPTQATVQRSADMPTGFETTTAAKSVQHAPVNRVEPAATPRPVTPSEAPTQPAVQQPVGTTATISTVTDATPAPEVAQRTPVERTEEVATPSPEVTSEPLAQLTVQRAPQPSVAPLTAIDTIVASEDVQRTPVDRAEEVATPSAEVTTEAPTQPVVQRSAERPTASPKAAEVTPAPESAQRTSVERSVEIATSSPDTTTEPPTPAMMQRSTETPAVPPTAMESISAPESMQRTPVDRVEDTAMPSADVVTESPTQPPVQRSVETLAAPPATAPERVQRTPVARVEEAATATSPAQAMAQRSTERPAASPAPEASMSVSEDEQRNPVMPSEPSVQPPADVSPFMPINRYRDPRVLARSVEPPQPVLQAELSLSRGTSPAVLPQARLATQTSGVDERVQRMPIEVAQPQWGEVAAPSPTTLRQSTASKPVAIQRSPEAKQERTKSSERNAMKVQPPSSRASSIVRRSPLPLAKLRTTSSSQVAQRAGPKEPDKNEPQDTVLAATAGTGGRGSIQTANLGGALAQDISSSGGDGAESQPSGTDIGSGRSNRQPPPDLDRLARAIVPIVKRMLTVERERRIPR